MRFPDPITDPGKKGKEWLLQYAKAVIVEQPLVPITRYAGRGTRMQEIRSYAMGRQSISIYQKALQISESASEDNWFTLDYTPLPIANKYRRVALGRLRDYDYTIQAYVVDPLSTSEGDEFLKKVKTAVRIKEVAKKVAPDMAADDAFNVTPGQPESMEEFDVWSKFSYKHRLAYETEVGIEHVLSSNDILAVRDKWRRDLFDFGLAVGKDCVEGGEVRVKWVDPRRFVISYCYNDDFSDAVYQGEIQTMTIARLREMAGTEFTEAEFEKIAEMANPTAYKNAMKTRHHIARYYDSVAIDVLELELITSDQALYKRATNKRGNKIVVKADNAEHYKPRKGAEYQSKTETKVYKLKHIINTDFIFNYGPCTHQKRRTGSYHNVSMSYHVKAYDMDSMIPVGIMELMIPVIDNLQLNWLKIQQAIITARPKGFSVNVSALEDVPITNGGTDMRPEELIRMFVRHGVLVYRQDNLQGVPQHGPPINEILNGVDPSIMTYWSNVQMNIQLLRDITGLNDVTDGSSINPKMLTTPTEMANAATNNALSGIVFAEEQLLLSVAESIVQRLQSMVMAGEVYVHALGRDTNEIFKLSKEMPLRDFGIVLEKRPTETERRQLIEEAKQLIGGEMLDFGDIFLIHQSRNLKATQALLEFRLKKKYEQKMQESMAMQQQNAMVQQQSSMAAEEDKRATLSQEYQLKAELMRLEYELKAQQQEMINKFKGEEGSAERSIKAASVLTNARIAANSSNGEYEDEEGMPTAQEMEPGMETAYQ